MDSFFKNNLIGEKSKKEALNEIEKQYPEADIQNSYGCSPQKGKASNCQRMCRRRKNMKNRKPACLQAFAIIAQDYYLKTYLERLHRQELKT